MNSKEIKIFRRTLGLFICIQPILELMWLNNGTIGEVFGFSIPTLIRMVFMGILTLEWLYFGWNIKKLGGILIYGIILGIYFVIHNNHCIAFNTLKGDGLGYSSIDELFYIVRMMIPIGVIFFTVECHVDRKLFYRCAIIISMEIAILVLITNLLKISYGSYTNEVIKINFFDWFFTKKDMGYLMSASKGWFYSSIISTILVLTLAYLIFMFLKYEKNRYILAIWIQSVALYMFGTKAASISVIICLCLMIGCYIVLHTIKVENSWKWLAFLKIMVTFFAMIFVFIYSPCQRRLGFEENYLEERNEEEEKRKEENGDELGLEQISDEDITSIIEYFDKNKDYLSINLSMLEGQYNYKYDPVFWKKFVEDTVPAQRMQNRYLEERILQRIQDINDNSADKFWGIGFTRASSVYNLERDFLYQYYSMGSIGAFLLLGPYIIVLLWGMIKMIFPIKNCTLERCALTLGLGLTFFVAYYSGNVMESLGITIAIGFAEGYFVNTIIRKETDKNDTKDNSLYMGWWKRKTS